MRSRAMFHCMLAVAFVAGIATTVSAQVVTTDDQSVDARTDTRLLAARLGDRDPSIRRKAAEDLAKLAAVDQKKMIEGYRLQEKDKQVRLALDWALYRTGKSDALYQVVLELDSDRNEQAVGYLSQIESPTLLHDFLARERSKPKVITGIIEVLTVIGNNESLELIKPLRDSLAPGVAAAAESAVEQIEKRLAEANNTTMPSRPRVVTTTEKTSPQ
jgi:hypothetical protein